MSDREVMQQALEALEDWWGSFPDFRSLHDKVAIAALRTALEQQQAEPVAWMFEDDEDNGHKTFGQTPPSPEAVAYLVKWNRPAWVPLYTAAPQRKPLTDELEAAFKEGWQSAKAAYGIKEEK